MGGSQGESGTSGHSWEGGRRGEREDASKDGRDERERGRGVACGGSERLAEVREVKEPPGLGKAPCMCRSSSPR